MRRQRPIMQPPHGVGTLACDSSVSVTPSRSRPAGPPPGPRSQAPSLAPSRGSVPALRRRRRRRGPTCPGSTVLWRWVCPVPITLVVVGSSVPEAAGKGTCSPGSAARWSRGPASRRGPRPLNTHFAAVLSGDDCVPSAVGGSRAPLHRSVRHPKK